MQKAAAFFTCRFRNCLKTTESFYQFLAAAKRRPFVFSLEKTARTVFSTIGD
jgi:hypothetical protein